MSLSQDYLDAVERHIKEREAYCIQYALDHPKIDMPGHIITDEKIKLIDRICMCGGMEIDGDGDRVFVPDYEQCAQEIDEYLDNMGI